MKIKSLLLASLLFIVELSYANSYVCGTNIDKLAQDTMQRNSVTGLSVAIIDKDKAQYCNYGYNNKDKKQLMSQYSIFEIGSITKTFTGTLAAIASVEGKINLLAPVNKYIISLKDNTNFNKINTQHLLTHVSGLPSKINPAQKVIGESELLTQLSKYKPFYLPQTVFQYSNLGITLAGLELERVYHKSYQQIFQDELLSKLNMRYTFFKVPQRYKHLLATGYNTDNTIAAHDYLGVYLPSGALKSNAYDLSKYLKLQINGSTDKTINKALQIIHKNYYCLGKNGEYHQQLVWEQIPYKDLDAHYNLESTIVVKSIKTPYTLATNCETYSDSLIEKTGNISGASTYLAYIPNKKIGVVVLMNKSKVSDNVNLGRTILKAFAKK
ncbi:MAG: serine hydrolase [Neisseriaceae bacterium]